METAAGASGGRWRRLVARWLLLLLHVQKPFARNVSGTCKRLVASLSLSLFPHPTRAVLLYFALGHCPDWAFIFYSFFCFPSFGLLLCLIFMQFTCNLCPFRLCANYLHFRFHLVQGRRRKAHNTPNSQTGGVWCWTRRGAGGRTAATNKLNKNWPYSLFVPFGKTEMNDLWQRLQAKEEGRS